MKPSKAKKTIRAEMSVDGDTDEQCLTIFLGTKSEGAAKIRAQRLIRLFNRNAKEAAKALAAENGDKE
jgi:hypothetical protein